jgi:hypothetical protein
MPPNICSGSTAAPDLLDSSLTTDHWKERQDFCTFDDSRTERVGIATSPGFVLLGFLEWILGFSELIREGEAPSELLPFGAGADG